MGAVAGSRGRRVGARVDAVQAPSISSSPPHPRLRLRSARLPCWLPAV